MMGVIIQNGSASVVNQVAELCELKEIRNMVKRPIQCDDGTVRAILAGTQTSLCKVIDPQPLRIEVPSKFACELGRQLTHGVFDGNGGAIKCPYGKVGDELWVQEAFITGWEAEDSRKLAFVWTSTQQFS